MASATTGLRRMDSATLAAMSADVLAQGGNPLSFDSIDTYFQNFMTRTQFGERLLEVYLKLSPLADGDDPIEAMKTFSTSVAPEYYFQAAWAKWGYNIFRLSDSLTSTFLLTDQGEIPKGHQFVMPFPAFVIGLPKGYLSIQDREGFSEVTNIHVTKYTLMDGTIHHWFSAYGESGVRLWMTRTPEGMCEGAPVQDLAAEMPKVFDFDTDVTDHDRWCREQILRICTNFLLWLDAKGGVKKLEQPFKSKKLKNGGAWPTSWILNGDTKLSKALLTAARDFAKEPGKRIKEWKLMHRHIVRGHSKMQPCGEGRAERKRIVVEPYFRGPDGEEAWSKVYQASDIG